MKSLFEQNQRQETEVLTLAGNFLPLCESLDFNRDVHDTSIVLLSTQCRVDNRSLTFVFYDFVVLHSFFIRIIFIRILRLKLAKFWEYAKNIPQAEKNLKNEYKKDECIS